MKSLVAVFILAISVVIALGCAAAGPESETNGKTPLTSGGTAVNDIYGNRIPQDILESFVEVPGGVLEKGRLGVGYYDSMEATDVFINRVGESTVIGDTSRYGQKVSVNGFSIMKTEVTVQMFTDFLNVISGKSTDSNSDADGYGVAFSSELDIYKPIMRDLSVCGIGRKIGGVEVLDNIPEHAGFYITTGTGDQNDNQNDNQDDDQDDDSPLEKTSEQPFVNPFESPQRSKVRSNGNGVLSSTFFVKNERHQFPMTCVDLDDAKEFCKWLGPNYRLPTSEEWSWASKGGRDVNFATSTGNIISSRDDNGKPTYLANIQGEYSNNSPSWPVKFRGSPNGYGIHDMTGNVAEWTYYREEDQTDGVTLPSSQRAIKGGSFATRSYAAASSWGNWGTGGEGVWAADIGFRVVYDNSRALSFAESIDPIP